MKKSLNTNRKLLVLVLMLTATLQVWAQNNASIIKPYVKGNATYYKLTKSHDAIFGIHDTEVVVAGQWVRKIKIDEINQASNTINQLPEFNSAQYGATVEFTNVYKNKTNNKYMVVNKTGQYYYIYAGTASGISLKDSIAYALGSGIDVLVGEVGNKMILGHGDTLYEFDFNTFTAKQNLPYQVQSLSCNEHAAYAVSYYQNSPAYLVKYKSGTLTLLDSISIIIQDIKDRYPYEDKHHLAIGFQGNFYHIDSADVMTKYTGIKSTRTLGQINNKIIFHDGTIFSICSFDIINHTFDTLTAPNQFNENATNPAHNDSIMYISLNLPDTLFAITRGTKGTTFTRPISSYNGQLDDMIGGMCNNNFVFKGRTDDLPPVDHFATLKPDSSFSVTSVLTGVGDSLQPVQIINSKQYTYAVTVVPDGFWQNYKLIRLDYCSGIISDLKEISLAKSQFVVYPNPTSRSITLESNNEIGAVAVYNLQGQLMHSTTSQQKKILLDIEQWPSGVYFIATKDNQKLKFTKQ
jgi:hypothetical protein